jgi:sterol desaturase/sphingolipid hydroxylase (fatty acid hydroxylase superfamily)
MAASLLPYEPWIRLGCFLAVFALVALAEALAPRRPWRCGRVRRWPANLLLVALDTLVLRLVFPGAAVLVAAQAEAAGQGLLPRFGGLLPLPEWAWIAATVVVLDLAIYLQHCLFHAVPLLWRLHRVHHADPDFDVSTALRFHPLEILLSLAYKSLWILALGLPPAGVLLFEVVLNATAMFNHGNLRLPPRWDAVLRLFIVTPDQHRVHHSVRAEETNSNYGFNLPWWDRLGGTYRAAPQGGHQAMAVGQAGLRVPEDCVPLAALLLLPFRRQ